MSFAEQEREKYERVWRDRRYREQNDGWPVVSTALEMLGCQAGESIIDWGCGTGACAEWFQRKGLLSTGFDIAHNCLNGNVRVPLVIGTIWDPPKNLKADYAFCTDVLEHIPPEHIEQTLDVLFKRTRKAAYIQVDTEPDMFGSKMDPPTTLHLCIQSGSWWYEQLAKRWPIIGHVGRGEYSRWNFLCRKKL